MSVSRFPAAALLTLLFVGCVAPGFGGRGEPAVEPPATETERSLRFVRDFVAAFNSGRPDVLADAYRRLFTSEFLADAGGADAEAWWRLELHRTYGDLEYRYVDTTATPAIVWTQGLVSRAWVGFQPYLDASGRATRQTVWRPRPIDFSDAPVLAPAQVADSLRAWLDAMAAADLFDGTVVLSHDGVEVLSGAWGQLRRDSPDPVRASTLFDIASVTKLLTVIALLQLVEAEVVSLDDALARWVPEYPEPWASGVTVRDLITHRSGIEIDGDTAYLDELRAARGVDDLLAAQMRALRRQQPAFDPDAAYDYTSEGVDLLGVVIERATGRAWRDVVRERVLEPADMEHTRLARPPLSSALAIGYTALGDDLEAVPGATRPSLDILPPVAKPSSNAWSNARDLHRLMRALLDGRLLGASLRDSMLTPALETGEFEKYGLRGWAGLGTMGEDVWGVRAVGHGGVVPGYSAAVEYFPANGWLLTVTSNTGEATGYLVLQRVMELVARGRATRSAAPADLRPAVDVVLDDFHAAAAEGDADRYLAHFTDDGVFFGTDATERWTRAQFEPYVRRGFASGGWTYVPRDRTVYFSDDGDVAWFDEMLDSPGGTVARGTGVLVRDDGAWRIAQYNFSVPFPNSLWDTILEMIREEGD